MIIANHTYGRLGNQLQLAAHLITFVSIENNIVCLQYLNKNSEYFPYFDGSVLKIYPKLNSKIQWIEKFLLKTFSFSIRHKLISEIDFLKKNEWIIFDKKSSDLNDDLQKLRKSFLCSVKLWRFRSASTIKSLHPKIKKVFTPRQEILAKGKQFIDSLKCDVVIGVHIRWGDYITAVPDCYHDLEVYKRRMLETLALFPGKQVGFIICTEEQIDLPGLDDFNYVLPKGSAIEDLYTLAQTDFLIASASTFSEWASFWGSVPSFTVLDANTPITSLENFVQVDLAVDL